MVPSGWSGSSGTGATATDIVMTYTNTAFGFKANANGGLNFLGLQRNGAYVSQIITLPTNTLFSVQFDVSARTNTGTPKLEVYCNAANNAGKNFPTLLLLLL